MNRQTALVMVLLALLQAPCVTADEGKLLATPGVTQFEGAAGGGLVPWAMLTSYASRDGMGVSAFHTTLRADDVDLAVMGAAINIRDRVELSIANQRLEVHPLNMEIKQRVFGAKVRLYGDLVYSKWPQLSVGAQYKKLDELYVPFNGNIDHGTDFYIATSKLHLGAVYGYNLLWNLTVRSTRAMETGFLGFETSSDGDYTLNLEGSIAVLLNQHFAVGVEYREKNGQDGGFQEEAWKDAFIAWFPNQHVNVTLAWVSLGNVGGVLGKQEGIYASITGYLQ